MKFLIVLTLTIVTFSHPFNQSKGLPGKWAGTVEAGGQKATLIYNFVLDKEILSGEITGPQGTVPIENGSYKDSVLSFDMHGRTMLHQTGRYYGDSVTIDVSVHETDYHVVLMRSK